ncbi:DUF2256 domain-containing protein [Pseudomonas syringae]|uniref:DUF2256 domain-containing protein n=1 Tax=Pseudomonas syringae TaxID=317 RepID=UPI003AF32A70
MKKSGVPVKNCATCGRSFAWRKKWARCRDALLLGAVPLGKELKWCAGPFLANI